MLRGSGSLSISTAAVTIIPVANHNNGTKITLILRIKLFTGKFLYYYIHYLAKLHSQAKLITHYFAEKHSQAKSLFGPKRFTGKFSFYFVRLIFFGAFPILPHTFLIHGACQRTNVINLHVYL